MAAMLALAGPFAVGLITISESYAQSGTSNLPQREFDAVSVKPYLPQGPISEGCNSHSDPVILGRTGCTLEQLVEEAYDLKSYQVHLKGAAWIDTDRYIIQARSAMPATEPEMMRMLQPVLAARFRMNVHWETRQAPVFLLQVTSQGPKLQPASNTSHCGVVNVREHTVQSDCMSIGDFAEVLQDIVKDRPVLDRTGMNKDGQYLFKLEYSFGEDTSAAPSLFSALPDQLGLTLKAAKASLRALVIDRAQRPVAN